MKPLLIIILSLFSLNCISQDLPYQRLKTPTQFDYLKATKKAFVPDTSEALLCSDTNRISIVNGKLLFSFKDSISGCARWQISGTIVKKLGDSAMIVGLDTVYLNSSLLFDLAPEYLIQSGRDALVRVRKYILDSVLIIKDGENLIMPNGDILSIGGAGTVITGFGISGNGSGGDPLKIDSALLRPDYIRNQYDAVETKRARLDSAWLLRLRTNQIIGTGYEVNVVQTSPFIKINRIITGVTGNARGIQDSTKFSNTGGAAYASFDSRVQYSGGHFFDHHAAFQNFTSIIGNSTIRHMYTSVSRPDVETGSAILNYYGTFMGAPTGGGSVDSAIGLRMEDMTKAGFRRTIYSQGGPIDFQSRNTGGDEAMITMRKNSFNPNSIMSIEFRPHSSIMSSRIGSRGVSVTQGDLVFDVNNTGGNTMTRVFELLHTGYAKFNQYGSGARTGTPTYYAAFDASGNLVESPGSVTINNNANNNILTATGTSTSINGESALTFDGTTLLNGIIGAGDNLTVTHLDLNRQQGALNSGIRFQTFVNTGSSSTTVRFTPYSVNPVELIGNWTTTGDHRVNGSLITPKFLRTNAPMIFEITANEGKPNPFNFFGAGKNVINPAINPIMVIDPEGRLQVGSGAANNSAILDLRNNASYVAFQLPIIATIDGLDSIQGIKAIYVSVTGSGYTSATVSITGGGGTGATATASLTGDRVTSITLTNPGSGYTSTPTVTVSGDGTLASATAIFGTLQPGMKVYVTSEGAEFVWNGIRWNANRFNGTKFQGWDDAAGIWIDLN